MKKRILSILLTLCMVLCLMPTAVFAEGNEDTPTQALTNVAITFPAPKVGENISEAMKAASGDADSGLKLYLFGPALWQQVYDCSGALLEEQYLCTNDAIMMYSPLLAAENTND